jgi:hypothetical protein
MLLNLLVNKVNKDSRGRILGRNPDKSLKSFPPCYSQSPLQLCLENSISSNSHNLLHISSNSHNFLSISTVQLLYAVKEKEGKPERKPYSLPYGLRNPYRNLSELSSLCPETLMELYDHEFGFRSMPLSCRTPGK